MDTRRQAGKLLILALLSEAVILTDSLAVLISRLIAPNLVMRAVITFLLVYVFWYTGIVLIRYSYRHQSDIQFEHHGTPSRWDDLMGLLLVLLKITISYSNWGGFKVVMELTNGIQNGGMALGIAYFAGQYLYYLLEAVLMVMILSFAEEAGTMIWENKNIPYGGIALAVIWGLVHIVFHGVVDGLTTTACAVLYGYGFLAMKKNVRYALPLVFVMFVV